MHENQVSEQIIGASINVHQELGPGLLESSYLECLYYELINAGHMVEKEKPLPLVYKEVKLECGYRVDLMVEKKVIVELKSVEALNDVHMAQVLTYLKLSNCKLGLLINFNVSRLRQGIRRIVYHL